MSRKQYQISESVAELERILKGERDGRRRDKVRLLWLLRSGECSSIRSASQLLNVTPTSCLRWIKTYEQAGLAALLGPSGRRGRTSALKIHESGTLVAAVETLLNSPSQSANSWKELWQLIIVSKGHDMSYHAFYQAVKRLFPHARLKVARPSHMLKDAEKAEDFKKNSSSAESGTKAPSRLPHSTAGDG